MEAQREELLSALRDAEQFISETLLNEPLSDNAQRKRRQLEIKLKSLTKRASYEDNEQQEMYDDVRENGFQPGNEPLSTQGIKLEGVPKGSTEDDGPIENYEDMSTEEFYDDTIPEQAAKDELYDDTMPGDDASKNEETETYEVADPDQPEVEETYEGVEDNRSLNSLDIKDRSGTLELESLMKPIKPDDVQGVILKGNLDKHRKNGIYIGSRWQKRYCVLRSFVLYYYRGPNYPSQKGSIILPGYTVATHKTNKEFILTRGEDRAFIFMAKSKEEAEKWMDAIRQAASTTKISKRQSEILEQLRCSGEGEEDTTSVNEVTNGNNLFEGFEETYDDVGQQDESLNTKGTDMQPDDNSQDLYEAPDDSPPEPPLLHPKPLPSVFESSPLQPMRPSKPPPPTIPPPEDGEEMYDDVGVDSTPPPQPARSNQPVSDIQPTGEDDEELYDDVGVSPPSLPPQPARPTDKATRPVSEIAPTTEEEEEELYDDVGVSPPSLPPQPARPADKPTRPVSEIAPTTEEEEELYDDVGVQGSEVNPAVTPAELKPLVPERPNLPPVPTKDSRPSPPITPRTAGRIPLPPTPNEAPKPIIPPRIPPQEPKPLAEENNNTLTPTPPSEDKKVNKAQPPPPPEEETEEQQIDYSCIYQALWDCKPDADDELEFCRGDLIYIYEKPHSDWWIGSKFKPQGYITRLIPTNFIIQAFEI